MPARRRFIDQPPSLDDRVDEPETTSSSGYAIAHTVAVSAETHELLVADAGGIVDDEAFAAIGSPAVGEYVSVVVYGGTDGLVARVEDVTSDGVLVELVE